MHARTQAHTPFLFTRKLTSMLPRSPAPSLPRTFTFSLHSSIAHVTSLHLASDTYSLRRSVAGSITPVKGVISQPPACSNTPLFPMRSSLAPSPPLTHTPARPPACSLSFYLCVALSLPRPRSLTHPPTHPPAPILPLNSSLASSPPTHSPARQLTRSLLRSLCVALSLPRPR